MSSFVSRSAEAVAHYTGSYPQEKIERYKKYTKSLYQWRGLGEPFQFCPTLSLQP
jgi:hypothetical protein